MKDNKKTPEELKELEVKSAAQAEQILEQEQEIVAAPIVEEATLAAITPNACTCYNKGGPGGPRGRGRGGDR